MTTPNEWAWFRRYVPVLPTADSRGIVAYRDQRIVAGCVLDNWFPNSVQIHHVLLDKMILRYGWLETLGEASLGDNRRVVYSLVPEDNKRAIRFNEHVGFSETGRVPDGEAPGVDYVLMSIQRNEFRYWRKNHG